MAHEIIIQLSDDDYATQQLYTEGFIENIATGKLLTAEEDQELEHLAQAFSGGKMASEMVIEDRGPY